MTRRNPARAPVRLTILLCRGCCCGTSTKHPTTDHALQERVVRAAVESKDDIDVRLVDCLDECDRSNVVVLRGASGRPAQRDTWLGYVLSDRVTQALVGWVADGACAPLPPALVGLRFRHVRRDPRRR